MVRQARIRGPYKEASLVLIRKLFIVTGVATLAGLVPIQQALAAPITTQDLDSGPTAGALAQTLAGEGVAISGVQTAGRFHAIGSFSGGSGIIGPDFDSGVVLSTGRVDDVPGPNGTDDETTSNFTGGDADLDGLTPGGTFDAAVLEFDFSADADRVFFQYVFSSEEYNEYVNTAFNDVFGFFVNGENCATIEGGQPVSINTINNGNPTGDPTPSNPHLYRNNDLSDGGGSIDIEMDGLTTVLTCEAPVSPTEPNHLKLAIADTSDSAYDSNVFIKAGSLSTEDPEPDGTDLAIDKTDSPDPVTTGGVVRYTIGVENQGEVDSGVQVLDQPSAGEVVGAEGDGWTCEIGGGGDDVESGSSALCTLDEPLPAGAAAPALMVYVQAPDVPGSIVNTATVSGDGEDPDPDDNTATEETTVAPSDDGEGEQQVVTFCPPSGCTFSTGSDTNEDDPTTNLVEVPEGGDGSVTSLHEGATTFPCGGGSGFGNSALGQETNFLPPTGLADPTNPIKVTTTWDVSVWPVHKGNSDPGVSNGKRGQGQVKICMRKVVEGPDGPEEVVFRLPRCEVVGVADPAPCWDQVSRDAEGDISVRILMLSEDPQWRR